MSMEAPPQSPPETGQDAPLKYQERMLFQIDLVAHMFGVAKDHLTEQQLRQWVPRYAKNFTDHVVPDEEFIHLFHTDREAALKRAQEILESPELFSHH